VCPNNKGRLMAHIQHQLWLTRSGTMQLDDINSIPMEPFPVISMVFMEVRIHSGYFIMHMHSTFHSLPKISLHWCCTPTCVDSISPLVSISSLHSSFIPISSLFPLVPKHCLHFTMSLYSVYTMPCERGKPKCGSTYYSFVSRHLRPSPSLAPSLPPNMFTSPVVPPHSNQNWNDDSQLPLGNLEPMPSNSDPVIDSGGCPIEEEIPPSWLEGTTMSTTPIFNSIPLIQPMDNFGRLCDRGRNSSTLAGRLNKGDNPKNQCVIQWDH
jgi:hypothetical protein